MVRLVYEDAGDEENELDAPRAEEACEGERGGQTEERQHPRLRPPRAHSESADDDRDERVVEDFVAERPCHRHHRHDVEHAGHEEQVLDHVDRSGALIQRPLRLGGEHHREQQVRAEQREERRVDALHATAHEARITHAPLEYGAVDQEPAEHEEQVHAGVPDGRQETRHRSARGTLRDPRCEERLIVNEEHQRHSQAAQPFHGTNAAVRPAQFKKLRESFFVRNQHGPLPHTPAQR